MADPFSDGPALTAVRSASRRRTSVRSSLDADDFINLLHGSDPVKVELNRLENEVRGSNVVRFEFFFFFVNFKFLGFWLFGPFGCLLGCR